MDDAELDDLERIWAAATPGPWSPGLEPDHDRVVWDANGDWLANIGNVEGPIAFDMTAANTIAIAKAPEHVGALIAEVRRMRGVVRSYRAEHDDNSRARIDAESALRWERAEYDRLRDQWPKWSLNPPTAEGPYWLRDHLRGRTYLAQFQDDEVWILEPEDGEEPRAEPIAEFGPERWEWAGPIAVPPGGLGG